MVLWWVLRTDAQSPSHEGSRAFRVSVRVGGQEKKQLTQHVENARKPLRELHKRVLGVATSVLPRNEVETSKPRSGAIPCTDPAPTLPASERGDLAETQGDACDGAEGGPRYFEAT